MLDHLKRTVGTPKNAKEERAFKYYGSQIPQLYFHEPTRIWSLVKKLGSFFQGLNKPFPREVTQTDTRIVVHKSAALAAQTFMLSMKAEGYDSCPMEGHDSLRIRKFLNLPPDAEVNMVIGVGPGAPEGIYGERIRIPIEEVVREI